MLKCVMVLSIFLSLNAYASEEESFKIECETMVGLLDEINKHVSEDKQIQMDYCEETHDTAFFGTIKRNFRAKLSLSAKSGLCSDAKFVEKEPTTLGYGAALGSDYINSMKKVKVLEEFGFMRGDIRSAGGLEGYSLTGLHYPICD